MMSTTGKQRPGKQRPGMRQVRLAASLALGFAALAGLAGYAVQANPALINRGAYLTTVAGCGDCHTPGHFFGKPDAARLLGGSEVGFEIPGLGFFYGSNLTPDRETGLGRWSEADIIKAIRTGVRPDGRILAPAMPVQNFAKLTDEDARAIAAYLKSLKPVSNKVPGPFGAQEKPTSFVMKILPPG
jgi:mono/diheme cytochrome c family protein